MPKKEEQEENKEAETVETEQVEADVEVEKTFEEKLEELQAQVQQLIEAQQPTDEQNEEQEEETAATDSNEADFTAREKALFDKQVALELKAEGLEDFAPLIHAENEAELNEQINKLKELVNKRKLNNSYKPSEHNNASTYGTAVKNRDVLSMLKTKINY